MHHIICVTKLAQQLPHCRIERWRPAAEQLDVWSGRRQLSQRLLAWVAPTSAPRYWRITQRVEDAQLGVSGAQLCEFVCHEDVLLLPVEAHKPQARQRAALCARTHARGIGVHHTLTCLTLGRRAKWGRPLRCIRL